jgi:hypothetical protein
MKYGQPSPPVGSAGPSDRILQPEMQRPAAASGPYRGKSLAKSDTLREPVSRQCATLPKPGGTGVPARHDPDQLTKN